MSLFNDVIHLGNWSKRWIALFDGAMGTELLRQTHRHLPCEEFNLTQPALVAAIHRSYLNAGADIIRTNSVGANRVNLEKYGLATQVTEINQAAVAIACRAIKASTPNRHILVAGSIGPIPHNHSVSTATVRLAYRQQAEALVTAGAGMLFGETFQQLEDIELLLETMLSVAEIARPHVALGVCISPPDNSERAAILAKGFSTLISRYPGVSLVGCNCGHGPSSMLPPITALRENTNLPIAALPSAGIPVSEGPSLNYPVGIMEFTSSLLNLIDQQSVEAVGGCCGTTPEYISALAAAAKTHRVN